MGQSHTMDYHKHQCKWPRSVSTSVSPSLPIGRNRSEKVMLTNKDSCRLKIYSDTIYIKCNNLILYNGHLTLCILLFSVAYIVLINDKKYEDDKHQI